MSELKLATWDSVSGSRPRVDWSKRDLDDKSEADVESLRRDYARVSTQPRIYQAWIPLWLLSERLWEEIEGGEYDWLPYRKDAVFPPLKIEIDVALYESMSFFQLTHIRDGNHRVRFWKECGFSEAPAWCLDYRLVAR